jgi:hypothetical protein
MNNWVIYLVSKSERETASGRGRTEKGMPDVENTFALISL